MKFLRYIGGEISKTDIHILSLVSVLSPSSKMIYELTSGVKYSGSNLGNFFYPRLFRYHTSLV